MSISMSAEPPFSWTSGTDLADKSLGSVHLCEAMQALKNRAAFVVTTPVVINDWKAYDHNGDEIADLGHFPNDNDLSRDHDEENPETFSTAARHIDHIGDIRTTLEFILPYYLDPLTMDAFTLSTLMQAAVGRDNYNHPDLGELGAHYGFDGEDVEELLKCIDKLELLLIPIRIYFWDTELEEWGLVLEDWRKSRFLPTDWTDLIRGESNLWTQPGKVASITGNLESSTLKIVFDDSGDEDYLYSGLGTDVSGATASFLDPYHWSVEIVFNLSLTRPNIGQKCEVAFDVKWPVSNVAAGIKMWEGAERDYIFALVRGQEGSPPVTRTEEVTIYKGTGNTSLSVGVRIVIGPGEEDVVQYTLTVGVSPPDSGYVTGGGPYDEDTTADVEAFPNEGWEFDHWEGDDIDESVENPEEVAMTSDKSVTAVFTEI